MKPSQHQAAGYLFDTLRKVPEEEQDDWLGVVINEVKSLLSCDDADTSLPLPSMQNPAEFLQHVEALPNLDDYSDADHEIGRNLKRIGRYGIVRVLGKGGMGTVYEAVQDHPRRKVALKLMKRGLATGSALRRFKHEAELLGRLQHPGIAQIFEAAVEETADGPQPYFAMELIEGQRLTEFADTNGLGIRQRLELMAKVCDAIHYAHQQNIIHRDLKPANILVDQRGQPKILDFGVARVTDADVEALTLQTEVGQLLGTLSYMSPEQVTNASKQLDTRSDVYALGVILYRLLSGRLPHDVRMCSIPAATRIIQEGDPSRLGSINSVFRGDVETIVLKAMEKDPSRRYDSASELATDIRRYLEDEPVSARPPSAWYQLSKFAKRNTALVSATAVLFIVLVGGLFGTSYGLLQARAEADRNLSIVTFFGKLLSPPMPYQSWPRDASIRDILDRANDSITERFGGDPNAEAIVRDELGKGYWGLELYELAVYQFQKELHLLRDLHGETSKRTLGAANKLGDVLTACGRAKEAKELARTWLDICTRRFGMDNELTMKFATNWADALQCGDQLEAAQQQYVEILEVQQRIKVAPADVGETLNSLGRVLLRQGERLSEAETRSRQAFTLQKNTQGAENPATLRAQTTLGRALLEQQKYAEAERHLNQAVELLTRIRGEWHSESREAMAALERCRNESSNRS